MALRKSWITHTLFNAHCVVFFEGGGLLARAKNDGHTICSVLRMANKPFLFLRSIDIVIELISWNV